MSSSSSTWADPDPGEGTKYYRIAALKPDTCYPTGTSSKKFGSGPYGQSISNIENNLMLGIKGYELKNTGALKIHPNPFSTTTTLVFLNPEGDAYTLYMMDLSGKICHIVNHITTSEYVLEKGNLKEGFYLLELRGPKIYRGKIMIE